MKLQICSLAALERLIAGDSELEVEVRNSIIQAFAKKHLKVGIEDLVRAELANTRTLTKKELKDQTEAAFKEWFTASWSRPRLREDAKETLRSEMRSEVISCVRESATAEIQQRLQDLPRLIDNRVECLVNAEIDRRVKAKLDQLKASL